MAKVSKGTVKTSSYDGRYYQLDWTCTQSIPNNQSTISWTLKAVGGSSSWYAERTLNVVIGGVTAYSKTDRVQRYAGAITSGTRVVNHNSTGDASITIEINAAVYVSSVNCTGSETFDLTNIPRKSALSVVNGTLGTAQNLTVTRQSTSFTHSIKAVCGSVTRYIKADGTLSTTEVKHSDCDISFTPPLEWASQNTADDEVTVKYTITTYNGNTNVGSNPYTKTCAIPESVKPSLSVSISEATELDWGVYVQSVSRLAIKITPTLAYGSAIATYYTTVDGKAYTSNNFTTEVLKGKGSLAITVTITDKRGRTATYNGTINVLEYAPPSITNLSVIRCNSDGTSNNQGAYAKVTFNYAFTSLGGQNELETATRYKLKSASAYTTLATDCHANPTSGTETHIFAATTSANYNIEIVAKDAIQTLLDRTASKGVATLGTIGKFLSFFKNVGLAIGKVYDTSKSKTVQVAWDSYFDKNVYVKDKPVRVKRCVCGQNGNSDENPWHKFASVTANEVNEDMRISFKITFAYGSVTRFGTLNAFIRTQNANGANGFQRLEFESDTGLDASNFVLAHSGTGVGAVYELWIKLSAYRFCQFEVLSESSRMAFVDRWTLYDSISLGEAATPTSGYTQISATKPYTLNSYPIGSYYIAHHNTSPAELFGGTWHRIESRFLWACPSTSEIGLTGGERDHTLTVSEMPAHNHGLNFSKTTGTYASPVLGNGGSEWGSSTNTVSSTGGGAAHNNMPPYVNVAIWRRTA